jgi:hypothetical protein
MLHDALILLILLQVKHFVCDWLYQPPYMYLNKGTFGHPGGLIHALWQGVGTAICLAFMPWGWPWQDVLYLIIQFAAGELFIHYMVDYGKMNLNRIMKWGPTTSEWFWRLTGFDQLLHQLTYVLVIWVYFLVRTP